MNTLLVLALFVGVSSGQIFRAPTASEIDKFLQAAPLHPTKSAAIIPPNPQQRVDYGVGLPGGNTKATESCSENRTLGVWDYGVIQSPKYPEDYPPSVTCQWLLTAPEGTIIQATVYDIDTQPWFLNYYDSVSVSRDGAFYQVDNYAGDQNQLTPFIVNSTGNKLGIRFKTDAIINYRGFKLEYIVRPTEQSQLESFAYPGADGVCGRPMTQEEEPSVSEPTDAETTTALPRIVGNVTAAPHSLPWMVAMLIDGKSFCGGTVIDNRHILTAAHCTNKAEQITILLGSHDLKSQEPQRLVVNVTKQMIFTHPKYNEDNVFNDISIIRLPEAIEFSRSIRPICLPNRRFLAEFFDRANVAVSGWGLTGDSSKTISPTLQVTPELSVMNNRECYQIFGDILTGNQICARTQPKSSPCRGDSGGPMYIRQKVGGGSEEEVVMQVGIVSFGTFTCERGFPVAFTRVTAFLDYINSVTGSQL